MKTKRPRDFRRSFCVQTTNHPCRSERRFPAGFRTSSRQPASTNPLMPPLLSNRGDPFNHSRKSRRWMIGKRNGGEIHNAASVLHAVTGSPCHKRFIRRLSHWGRVPGIGCLWNGLTWMRRPVKWPWCSSATAVRNGKSCPSADLCRGHGVCASPFTARAALGSQLI